MKHFFTFILTVLFLVPSITTSYAQTNWTKATLNNPILECGEPGSWDELYIQHSSVVFDGSEYHMWYHAQSAIPDDWAIGHATSQDGIFWIKDSSNNPVLTKGSAGTWDQLYVCTPSVVYDDSIFHMWYTGTRDQNAENNRIGYASSSDGINWQKYDDTSTTNPLYAESDPVLFPGTAGNWDDRLVEAPAVILEGNTFIMWYRGVKNDFNWTDGIGRATSTDGITWNKDTGNNPVLTSGSNSTWEKNFLRLGSVVFDGIKYHLFYYAGEFYMDFRIGYAWSYDGADWTKYDDTTTTDPPFSLSDPVLTWDLPGSWDDTQVFAPWVILDSLTSTFKMWYSGADDVNTPGVVVRIGYATALIDPNSINTSNKNIPKGFVLSPNYPNPFNPTTTIEYSIPNSEFVTLKIFNLLGQEVATLVSEKLNAGSYKYDWDASGFASGVYYYKLEMDGGFMETKKLILMK